MSSHDTVRVALIGTGLIGASLGLALAEVEEVGSVIGFDVDAEQLAQAKAMGAITDTADTAEAAAEAADVVVLAVPPSHIPSVAEQIADHLRPGTILTDVGSVKAEVVAAMERAAPDGVHVVGGHPMAGSHEHGAAHASGTMFVGATYLLTPTPRTDAAAMQRLNTLIEAIGARVVVVDTEAHDLLVAIVSHLPQLTATTLMSLAAERARRQDARLLLLAGGGFRDATRVAASNPAMWLDICRDNREAIVAVLDEYAARIGQLRMMLFEGDEDRLVSLLTDAREARRSLPGKESVSGQLVELRIPIPDRPGAIAEITTTVSDLGVNIEDLGIEHAPDGRGGTMRLAVNGLQAAGTAHAALEQHGYEVIERRP
ncbi:prephenate dehydrogenase [Euzebya tangerina]|uniref:prephenate dehydrogenase n=1 Tax=Euzebya tangerina TaxID=591198 RepID=UPI000E31F8AE|nr:prephenate dehydrogenase [Euzebya tangerina]